MNKISFPVLDLRTVKDPTLGEGVKRTSFYVRVQNVPAFVPKDVNPRSQNTNKKVYRDIRDSLLGLSDTPGLFHLRNQGITILADKIDFDQSKNICTLGFEEIGEKRLTGIVNGGHTYEIIRSVVEEALESNDQIPNEFVKMEVITGLDHIFVPEIAEGLNTSLQVKAESITNLEGKFDWLKEVFSLYKDNISWDENGHGNLDVADIVKYLTCLNFIQYPDANTHPIVAYNNRSKIIEQFSNNSDEFKVMENVLIDICKLHDAIALGAQDVWNDKKNGHGKFGQSFLAKKRSPKYRAIFLGNEYKNDYTLHDAAILPILSAFRVYLALGDDGKAHWKIPFDQVIKAWREIGFELLGDIWEASSKSKMTNVGRDTALWKNLYRAVAMKEISER